MRVVVFAVLVVVVIVFAVFVMFVVVRMVVVVVASGVEGAAEEGVGLGRVEVLVQIEGADVEQQL